MKPHFHPISRCASTIGMVACLFGATISANEVSLVHNGVPRAVIMLEPEADPAVQSAANLLSEYVEKSSGVRLPVQISGNIATDHIPIHFDLTADSFDKSEIEAYQIHIEKNSITITSATPRGAFYAVVDLIEKQLGVRWWNFAGEECVPAKPDIDLTTGIITGGPTVFFRDMMVPGRSLSSSYPVNAPRTARHWALWRLNGSIGPLHANAMSLEPYGGLPRPLRTHCAHTLGTKFLSPDKWMKPHPEIFALINGKHSKDGYSFAHPVFRSALLDELREAADADGDGVYVISPPDNWAFCQSPKEQAFNEKHSSRVASYLDAMNEISQKLKNGHNGVQLEMLAYNAYEDPPTDMQLSDHVTLRFCPITRYHWDAFDDEINRPWLDKLSKWRSVARDIQIWEYPGHYGSPQEDKQGNPTVFRGYDRYFPQPNIFHHGRDFSSYTEAGAKGIFSETDAGMADLYCEAEPRYWIIARMLWQPLRDAKPILREFCEGYYGPAGQEAMEYFELLDTAYRKDPSRVAAHLGDMAQQTFFSHDFCRHAQEIFDRGAAKLNDPQLARRWDCLRLSLDVATLFYWNRFEAEGFASPMTRTEVEGRLLRTRQATVALYFPDYSGAEELKNVERLLQAARKTPVSW